MVQRIEPVFAWREGAFDYRVLPTGDVEVYLTRGSRPGSPYDWVPVKNNIVQMLGAELARLRTALDDVYAIQGVGREDHLHS